MIDLADFSRFPLYMAAQEDHLPVAQWLLEYGVNKDTPDNDGVSPFCFAATVDHSSVVLYLLDNTSRQGQGCDAFQISLRIPTNFLIHT